jgi:putative transposase
MNSYSSQPRNKEFTMSFWRNYYHLVWATKNREPLIQPEFEDNLYRFLIAKAAELGCYTYAIGGDVDHVHVALANPPKNAVSEVMKTLKGASSYHVNHFIRPAVGHFDWQRGYGCMTFGETNRAWVVSYIQQQKQHHAENTINAWLERMDELEEGPLDLGLSAEMGAWRVREEGGVYSVFPF